MSWAARTNVPVAEQLLVRLRLRLDLRRIESIDLVDELVRHQVARRDLVLDHVPLEEELDVGVEILDRAFPPTFHPAGLEAPMCGAREERLHVVADGDLLALPARPGLRIDLV